MKREPPLPCGYAGGSRNLGGSKWHKLQRLAKKLKPKMAILKGVK